MMGRTAHASSSTSLTLSWALSQLNKQLGCGGGLQPARPSAEASCGEESSSGASSLACVTPTNSDGGIHPAADDSSTQQQDQQQQRHLARPRSTAHLSVRWAEALEQHGQRAHAPQHGHFAPDKPCLKQQQSRFPFLEEATQLEALLRRPRARVLAQLNIGDGGGSSLLSGPADAVAAHAKKRSRVAAFGQ